MLGQDSFHICLPSLELPALRKLSLRDVYSAGPVKELLARSNCALQLHTLCLIGRGSFGGDAIREILVMTRNPVDLLCFMATEEFEGDTVLSHVFLSSSDLDDPEFVAHPGPLTISLPRLEQLEVTLYNTTREGIAAFFCVIPTILPSLESAVIEGEGADRKEKYCWTRV